MMNVNGSGFSPQYIPPADLTSAGDGGIGIGSNAGGANNNNANAGALSLPLTVTFSSSSGMTPVDFGQPSVSGVNGVSPNSMQNNALLADPAQNGGSAGGAGGGQMAELMNMLRQLLSELLKMLGGGASDPQNSSDQQNSAPAASSGGGGAPAASYGGGDGGAASPAMGNNLLAAQPGAGADAANGASGSGATSGVSGLSGSGDLHLPSQLEPFRQDISNAAQATGMPASVIAGQIWAESRGNLSAASTNGGNGKTDAGLMQVNPDTYNEMKNENPGLLSGDPNSAQNNIMAGALYLKQQTSGFGGNIGAGLRAYNSGPDNVNLSNLSDISKTGTGAAPYVDNVLNFAKIIASGQGQLPA